MNESTNGALRATFDRGALHLALALLNRCVERRNTIPILSNVLIESTGAESVRFTANSLDQSLAVTLRASVEAAGRVTCDAAALADIVKKCPAGAQVELSAIGEGKSAKLAIVAGRARVAVQTLPVDDFPIVGAVDSAPWQFTYNAAVLAHDLARLAPCISTEETRYHLNGVSWRCDDTGVLALAATDGTIGATVERPGFPDAYGLGLPDDPEYAGVGNCIMPRPAVDLLQRALKLCNADSVALAFDKARCSVAVACPFGAVSIVSKLIDGTFPDLQGRGFQTAIDGNPVAVAADDWRLNPRLVAKLSKSLGGNIAVALGDAGCIVTCPGAPEYRAVIAPFRPADDASPDGARPMRDAKGNVVEGAYQLPDLDEPLPYVEILARPVYMGAFLPDGWTLPVAVAVKKAKRDDAAALAAYCAGNVAAAPVPVWTGAGSRVWSTDELQYVADGYGYIWRDIGAMIADYADDESSDDAAVMAVAAMSPAARVEAAAEAVELSAPIAIEALQAPVSVESDEPAQSATEGGVDAEALAWLEMAALPDATPDATPFAVPDALRTSQFDKPAADVAPDLAALVASLVARIEALESERAPVLVEAADNTAALVAEARSDRDSAMAAADAAIERAEARADDLAAQLAAMTRDRDDWQAIAEQNSARLDSERAERASEDERKRRDRDSLESQFCNLHTDRERLARKRSRTAAAIMAMRQRRPDVAQWRDDLDNARVALAAVTARAERAESELKRRAVLDPLAGLRYAGGAARVSKGGEA